MTDVADAAILHRLFSALYDRGAVIVHTSNRVPEDLYERGLQRELFVPFIGLTRERNIVHALDSGVDHRLRQVARANATGVYSYGPDASLESALTALTDGEPAQEHTLRLSADGSRTLTLRRAWPERGVVAASFEELCASAVGAAEYIAIANAFHTLVLEHVPQLSLNTRNEARRFITLIDELYTRRVRLVASFDVPLAELFVTPDDDTAARMRRLAEAARTVEDVPYAHVSHAASSVRASASSASIDPNAAYDANALFTGEEEAFAFRRAMSRLVEMSTPGYLGIE